MDTLPRHAIPERKAPVIVKPEYVVSFERTSGMTFVHCEIKGRWSVNLKLSLLADWKALLSLHDAPIFALHTPGDTKHHKFLTMFGFKPHATYTDAETDKDMDIFVI